MKIAFYALRPFDELPFVEKYCKEYGYDFVWTSEYPNKDNLSMAEGCQAFSCTPCEMTEEWAETLYNYGVRYMLCRAIGFDHLPMEYMKKKGMKATTSPYPPECVANYAIMLILMTSRKMNETMLRARVQDYSLKGKMGKDLSEMTVGVLGTGNIGATVIRHLAPFGCRILTSSRRENPELKQYAQYVDMDTLLAESDIITVHMASNAQTYHTINAESIKKMKDGVILINTSRGALVDTQALIDGLKSGKISEAGIDVLEDERNLYYVDRTGDVIDNDPFNILRSLPNVILTPHTAFYTETTVRNMVEKGFIALKCYEEGKPNPYEVG